MLARLASGSVLLAAGALALSLVLLSGPRPAQAAIGTVTASSTLLTAGAAGTSGTFTVVLIDSDEGAGDVTVATTGGGYVSAAICDPSLPTAGDEGNCTLQSGGFTPAGGTNIVIDDDAAAPGGGLDLIFATFQCPTAGPAISVLTATQGGSSQSVTITCRGTAALVQLTITNGADTTVPANVLNATGVEVGQGLGHLRTVVLDGAGNPLSTGVTYTTSNGSLSASGATTNVGTGIAQLVTISAGDSGDPGESATVTARIPSGANATATVRFGGAPSACGLTAAPTSIGPGGRVTISASVTDSTGGPVPDGTLISFASVSATPGANLLAGATRTGTGLSTAPISPGNGNGVARATLIAAAPGSIQLLASHGSLTCTTSVTVTGGSTLPPVGGSGGPGSFLGTAPLKGIALLVTRGVASPGGLVGALQSAGCTAEILGVITAGEWRVFIVGAPQFVNARFPGSLADLTPFYVRCR